MNTPTGNAAEFTVFLDQISMQAKGKTVAIILDNASFHKSRQVQEYLAANSLVKLLYLPTYSPEYNPIERIWKWAKTQVHGAKTIENGIEELIERFRRIVNNWMNGTFAKNPQIGLGVWEILLGYYI